MVRSGHHPETGVRHLGPNARHNFLAQLLESDDIRQMAEGAYIKDFRRFRWFITGLEAVNIDSVGDRKRPIRVALSFLDGDCAVFVTNGPDAFICAEPLALELKPAFIFAPG